MTDRGTAPAIVATGLTKRYGDVTAVDDLSFAVRSGAVTGFLGPNGAGKTTTLRMVLGLAAPDRRAARPSSAAPYAELPDPARTVGADLEICGLPPRPLGPQPPARARRRRADCRATRVDEVLAPGRD